MRSIGQTRRLPGQEGRCLSASPIRCRPEGWHEAPPYFSTLTPSASVHLINGHWKVATESHKPINLDAYTAQWTVNVPAGEKVTLSDAVDLTERGNEKRKTPAERKTISRKDAKNAKSFSDRIDRM